MPSSTAVETTARAALNKILKLSIERRKEYGAMICLQAGKYVGQHEDNRGCPPGSKPVAYYHTHPLGRDRGDRRSTGDTLP